MKALILTLFIFSIFTIITPSVFAQPASLTGESVTLSNPIGEANPNIIIGKIINAILGIVGSLALLMFIYGGFMWMLAAGNNERVQKGKDILIWATIGLVVIFSAYALIKMIFQGLGISQ